MALQLDTVFVWVTDLERSLPWYADMGIDPGPRYGPWQSMETAGETRFALHEGPRPGGGPTSVPSFLVADLDAEIDRLASRGLRPSDDKITDTGAARFITFTDPDGNEIQLLQR